MERSFWRDLIDHKYRLPEGHSLVDLTVELLDYLASPDPELRDTFGYNILARWIILYGYYTPDELRAMCEWLSPRLTEALGEQNTDSVFLRSYVALVFSLIMYRDNQIGFLNEVEVRSLLDRARHYLVAEQDLRAYVPGKGWANACSHTADLLKFLARSEHLDQSDLLRLLDTITDKLTASVAVVYTHDEDDRLAQAVMSALRRDRLTLFELSNWLKRFKDWKAGQMTIHTDYNPVYHAGYQNVKNFLRSLYYYMQFAPTLPLEAQDFQVELEGAIRIFSL